MTLLKDTLNSSCDGTPGAKSDPSQTMELLSASMPTPSSGDAKEVHNTSFGLADNFVPRRYSAAKTSPMSTHHSDSPGAIPNPVILMGVAEGLQQLLRTIACEDPELSKFEGSLNHLKQDLAKSYAEYSRSVGAANDLLEAVFNRLELRHPGNVELRRASAGLRVFLLSPWPTQPNSSSSSSSSFSVIK